MLSDAEADRMQEWIAHHSPEDWGIATSLWSRCAVQQLILQQYDLMMPLRTAGEYLKRWGYS